MIQINTKDGTNAGRRHVKVLPDWYCECWEDLTWLRKKRNPGTLYACPDCQKRRPK